MCHTGPQNWDIVQSVWDLEQYCYLFWYDVPVVPVGTSVSYERGRRPGSRAEFSSGEVCAWHSSVVYSVHLVTNKTVGAEYSADASSVSAARLLVTEDC